jgi:carboxypeptidase C (cathepsin A)
MKQIADELGVDKQRVYRFIKKYHINEAHRDAGVMWYDDVAVALIYGHFKEITVSSEVHQITSNDVVVDTVVLMLKNELDIKNKQIEDLTLANRDLTAALVAAQQTAAAAQALHAGTMQTQLLVGGETENGVRQKSRSGIKIAMIFKRLLGKE